MTGKSEKLAKPTKKSFSIVETICYWAAKYFCSLWATQNLSRSPSLMLRLFYLHRFTSFGVIVWKNFMLLLHLLLSSSFHSNPGPRTTRPYHFLSLYKDASSFSVKKQVRSCAFRCLIDPHITYPEMKTKGTTTSKKCHQRTLYATPVGEVIQLQDGRPSPP